MSSGLVDINMETLKDMDVIFNFYQATSLVISGVAVRGHVLAPFADVRDATGVVYGNFYANSFSGTLQFNVKTSKLCAPPRKSFVSCDGEPTGTRTSEPTFTPTPSPPPTPPHCVDLGPVSSLNALIFKQFTAGARVQGRLAVGGNAALQPGTSVGDMLTNVDQCAEATFIVGGALQTWFSGQNYFGNIVVGSKSTDVVPGRVLVGGCCMLIQQGFFDFDSAQSRMISLSQHLSSLPSTTVRFYADSGQVARIIFSGKTSLEIVHVLNPNLFLTVVSSIQFTGYSRGAVIVFNIAGDSSGFDAMNFETLSDVGVIFNFYEAKTVTVRYTAVRGMILAPYAHISAFSGEIYGKVVASSYTGDAIGISLGVNIACSSGNSFPIACENPDPIPPDPPAVCIDLGIVRKFNGFFWEDYSGSSDVQGRLAVGRNAMLAPGYSVGDQLTGVKKCAEATLVVGGNLTWLSGRNYYGNIVVGSAAQSEVNKQVVIEPDCCLIESKSFVDFAAAKNQLMQLSRALSVRPSTVTRFDEENFIVYLSQSTEMEVININDLGVFSGRFSRMPIFRNYLPKVPIIININGQIVTMSSHNQDSATDLPIYFNFFEAQILTIQNIAVRGNILAPHASINNAMGVTWGSIYARTMTGPMQINIGPFAGACPTDDNYTLPATSCDGRGPYGSRSDAGPARELKAVVWMLMAFSIFILF